MVALSSSLGSIVDEDRRVNYLNALNVTATQVASLPTNYTNNNHFTNALLAKLVLYREAGSSKDYDDSLNIANYIITYAGVDTSFGGLFGAPLLTGGLGKPLPPEIIESLSSMLYAALPDDPTQPWCDISYSNIYLMHTANLITLGEALSSYGPKATAAAEAGYHFFQAWLQYSARAGLHEFDSPTYTSVQMNGLYILSLYAEKIEARNAATQVLDFLWYSAGASWFSAGQMQAGPHSRDYDFLFGKGLLNSQLYLAGITENNEDDIYVCEWKDVHCEALVCPWSEDLSVDTTINCIGSGLQAVFVYLALVDVIDEYSYSVPPGAMNLSSTKESKWVEKRWQEGDAGDYHLYVSSNYALGLISDDYDTNLHTSFVPYPPNAQDKIFSLAFPSFGMSETNPLPVISFSPDWRYEDVYGKHVWESAGKPVHLRMRPTAVLTPIGDDEDTSVAVMWLAIDPLMNETAGWEPTNATHLALNTLIPWIYDGSLNLRVNGEDVTTDLSNSNVNTTISAGDRPIITLWGRGAAATLRILEAETCGDLQTSYSNVVGDAEDTGGLIFNSIRLETVLFDSDKNKDVRNVCKDFGYLTIGIIIAARNINSSDEAMNLEFLVKNIEFQSNKTETDLDVLVWSDDWNTNFTLGRDLSGVSEAMQGAIKYRKVNSSDVMPIKGSSIHVNGEAVVEIPTKF